MDGQHQVENKYCIACHGYGKLSYKEFMEAVEKHAPEVQFVFH